MSETSRSYGKSRDIKCKAIHLLGLLIVINSATAIDYAAYRRDVVPRGTHRQPSITTRNILEQLNRRNGTSRPSLQDATEHLLQYGALLRIQILDTFGKLVYDHYDDFGMHQIEALYRVYSETLERKYNIFDIVPSVLEDPDTRPTHICAHINKHVRTCLKESSQVCTSIKIHDEAHAAPYGKRALDSTRRIYRSGQISKNYPNGFSLKAVLHHLRAGRLRLTSSLFSGLLHNVQYDNFDDKVRTAERELVAYLGKPSTTRIARKLEKSMPRGRKVSELLKNYLSSGSKLFDGRAANRASYLSKHVIREVDAVSENIELLGTVYDNSTINLKYLFELILPNDYLPPDVLEARDYLLRELTTKKIVETYLNIEKYQQNGPDQLLLEILGQLRDIGFAEDLVTSLYVHARFWHKSHMVGNVNELLELFDAYENLRELKNYRGLVNIIRVIKNNLRNSKNVTVELLCSRPRECLRIGLRLVLNCTIVNERTKRAIEQFIQRTTYGCSYLKEDTVDESISGEIWESPGNIGDQVKGTIGDDYLIEESGSGEQNYSRKPSLTLMDSTKSIAVSKYSIATPPWPHVTPTEPAPLTRRPEPTEDPIQNILDLSIEVGQSPTTEEPQAETTTEKKSQCGGTNCTVNHKVNSDVKCTSGSCNASKCSGKDCRGCKGARNCSKSGCEDGDCGSARTVSDDCEGDDCEKDDCYGQDCSDRPVTPKIATTGGNETTRRINHECEGVECAMHTTPMTASPTACQGDECSTERLVAEPCKDADCSGEVFELTPRPCTGENCPESGEICYGKDCATNNRETTTEVAKTVEATTTRLSTTSTQPIIVPLTKPMIICNNSDPHYQRKLNRLRKIRLIDALSSKPMSSYETFDKLFTSTSRTRTNRPERTNSKTRITEKTILTTDLSEETPARNVMPAKYNLKLLELEKMRMKTKNEGKRIVKKLEQASPKRTRLITTRLNEPIRTTKSLKKPRSQTTKLEAIRRTTKSSEEPGLLLTSLEETSWPTKNPKISRLQTTRFEEIRRTTGNLEKPKLKMKIVKETRWVTKNPKKAELPITNLKETSVTTKNRDKSRLRTTTLEETSEVTRNRKKPRLHVTNMAQTNWVTKQPKEPRLQNANLRETIWQTKSPKESEMQLTDLETSGEITKYTKAPRLEMEELEETRWTEKNPEKARLKMENLEETSWTTKNPRKPRLQVTDMEETSWTTKNPRKPILQVTDMEETRWSTKNPKKSRLQLTDMEETSWTTKNPRKPRLQVTDMEETRWSTKNPKKSRLQVTDMEETSWTMKNPKKPRLQVTELEETSWTEKNPEKARLKMENLEETSWTTKNSRKPRLQVTDMEETSWTTKNPRKPRLQVTDMEETRWSMKNPKKSRLQVTDMEETSWTTKNPKKPRLQVTELEETSWTEKNPEKARLKMENLEETSWTTKNSRKPRLQVTDVEETSWTTKNPRKPRLQVTDVEETSWTTKNRKKPRLQVTDMEETRWSTKNPKKPRLQVTDMEETSWTTKNPKKPRLQVTDMEETSWSTKNRKKPRLQVTDMEETTWTTKNPKHPRFHVTDMEETSRTRKNPRKPRLQMEKLEETRWTTKKAEKPRLTIENLEKTSWTKKNPSKQRLQVTELEETSWTTKNSKKPTLPVEDLEETSRTTKVAKKPRLQVTDLEETSWTTKVSKKPRLPVTDQDEIIWTKKNLSKPRPKLTKILSKPTSPTKSSEETISRTNDRARTAWKRQNQRTTSFETNGPTNTITEMKSMKKVSYKGRTHRNDPLVELLRNKGKASRSTVSTRERANQQSEGYDVSRSYEIGESSNNELEKTKSASRLSHPEEDDSPMEQNGSSKNFSTTRHRVKSGSMKMVERQAKGVTKTKRIVTSDGDDGEARDSISSETMRGEIAKTIGSARGQKRWRWSARQRRTRIIPDIDINGYQSMMGQPTVVKPGRHFSRRVYKMQGSNEQTRTMKRVPEMHQIQEHESEFQAIGDDAPKMHKIRKWKIHETGEEQPKIHKMSKHEVKIHEFGDDDPATWQHDWQSSEIREQDPKIRDDKVYRIRSRGSKIHKETVDGQPEAYEMEDLEPTKMSRKRVVREVQRKFIVHAPPRSSTERRPRRNLIPNPRSR